ncbi:hypothetical protein Ciccas_001624 [Cichlidogyrus casuarinus]|uniref:UspA domain-containing protein n=1 Tax=Cichlidogyrus casuarinus TaxID=1844966 RepID=A0ABD2QJH0_9PLAT
MNSDDKKHKSKRSKQVTPEANHSKNNIPLNEATHSRFVNGSTKIELAKPKSLARAEEIVCTSSEPHRSHQKKQYCLEFFDRALYNPLEPITHEVNYVKSLGKKFNRRLPPDIDLYKSLPNFAQHEKDYVSMLAANNHKSMLPAMQPVKKMTRAEKKALKNPAATTMHILALTWAQISKTKRDLFLENQIYLTAKQKRAYFVCDLCGFECVNFPAAVTHCERTSHKEALQTELIHNVIYYLPPISEAHHKALIKFLDKAVDLEQIDANEVLRRKAFAQSVMNAFTSRIPGLTMYGAGSTYYGLCQLHSNVNMFCVHTEDDGNARMERGCQLRAILETLKKVESSFPVSANNGHNDSLDEIVTESTGSCSNDNAANKVDKFNALTPNLPKMPQIFEPQSQAIGKNLYCISFYDPVKVKYVISMDFSHVGDWTKLANVYLQIDEDCLWLTKLFMRFSKMAYMVSPEDGTMPPIAVIFMVIFYLQHYDNRPMLPNLQHLYQIHKQTLEPHEYTSVLCETQDVSFINNVETARRLWLPAGSSDENSSNAFKFYLENVAREDDHLIILSVLQPQCSSKDLISHNPSPEVYFGADSMNEVSNRLSSLWFETQLHLKSFQQLARQRNIRSAQLIVRLSSRPAPAVMEVCNETNANLLVLGRCSHSGLALTFLGSVATSLLHNANIPCIMA